MTSNALKRNEIEDYRKPKWEEGRSTQVPDDDDVTTILDGRKIRRRKRAKKTQKQLFPNVFSVQTPTNTLKLNGRSQ